jgi:hypothetical protein
MTWACMVRLVAMEAINLQCRHCVRDPVEGTVGEEPGEIQKGAMISLYTCVLTDHGLCQQSWRFGRKMLIIF